MGLPFNGDLVPVQSGFANLGVDAGPNSLNAFDFNSLRPFGHIHLNSGVFHHPTSTGWESGVIRFNSAAACMEVSVDGGITFGCIATTDNAVTSVGVLGGADLTGDVDLTSTSGFLVIGDTAGSSPVTLDVDVHALSGLWSFPQNGFVACYAETFTAATSWTVTHNLNTTDVDVMVLDASSPRVALIPDEIAITDVNTVTISFNIPQAGRAVIFGC